MPEPQTSVTVGVRSDLVDQGEAGYSHLFSYLLLNTGGPDRLLIAPVDSKLLILRTT